LRALYQEKITINGKGSLLKRPWDFCDDIVRTLGVRFKSIMGKLPIQIQGPLQAKDMSVDESLSSHFLTDV